jgi:hypothetical protein
VTVTVAVKLSKRCHDSLGLLSRSKKDYFSSIWATKFKRESFIQSLYPKPYLGFRLIPVRGVEGSAVGLCNTSCKGALVGVTAGTHGHGHGWFIKTRVTEKFTPFPRRT